MSPRDTRHLAGVLHPRWVQGTRPVRVPSRTAATSVAVIVTIIRFGSNPDDYGVTRQNLSNHLSCLRGCGLVVAVPQGRRTRYELADPRLAHALADLLGLVLAVDPAACPDSGEKGCC